MSPKLPIVKPSEVIHALEKAGFVVHHIKGSHYVLKHPHSGRRVPVPYHAKALKKGMLHGVIRQSGLSREEFLGSSRSGQGKGWW